MEKDNELQKRVRRSIEKLSRLNLQVSAELFPNDVIATKINEVIDELRGTARAPFGLLANVQSISTEDKIAQLDEEIQELSSIEIAECHGKPKRREKIKQARKHLEKYRDLVERGIGSEYIKPPAYKKELTDEAIRSEYFKLKSYRGAAKTLGCSPKTVKARLVAMGLVKK